MVDTELEDGASNREETGNAAPKKAKNRILTIGLPLLILVAATGGLLWWLNARNYVSTDDAYIDAHVVRIAPQIAGVVSDLTVEPNQRVDAGDLLVAISPDTVMPVVEGQRAGISEARARASEARSAVQAARAQQQRAAAAVRQAQADMAHAQDTLDRLLNARSLDAGAVAQNDIVAARTSVANAGAALAAARSDASAANAQLANARSGEQAARAAIEAADAQAAGGQVALDQTRIAAPMAGSIANISINQGSYVSPGLQMMALVPDELWVTANFKETDLDSITVGDNVSIAIDAYPGRSFAGELIQYSAPRGKNFSFCPRRTRPAISLRWCSAFRCALSLPKSCLQIWSLALACRWCPRSESGNSGDEPWRAPPPPITNGPTNGRRRVNAARGC